MKHRPSTGIPSIGRCVACKGSSKTSVYSNGKCLSCCYGSTVQKSDEMAIPRLISLAELVWADQKRVNILAVESFILSMLAGPASATRDVSLAMRLAVHLLLPRHMRDWNLRLQVDRGHCCYHAVGFDFDAANGVFAPAITRDGFRPAVTKQVYPAVKASLCGKRQFHHFTREKRNEEVLADLFCGAAYGVDEIPSSFHLVALQTACWTGCKLLFSNYSHLFNASGNEITYSLDLSPLRIAIGNGHRWMVERMVGLGQLAVDAKLLESATVDPSMLSIIVDDYQRRDINIARLCEQEGVFPLHAAASVGSCGSASMLLGLGVNPSTKTKYLSGDIRQLLPADVAMAAYARRKEAGLAQEHLETYLSAARLLDAAFIEAERRRSSN